MKSVCNYYFNLSQRDNNNVTRHMQWANNRICDLIHMKTEDIHTQTHTNASCDGVLRIGDQI